MRRGHWRGCCNVWQYGAGAIGLLVTCCYLAVLKVTRKAEMRAVLWLETPAS